MRIPQRFLLSLVVALWFAACGDDGGYDSPQTCQLECERAAQCSPRTDPRACRDQCAYPSRPSPPPLSPRYLDAVRRCLATISCDVASLGGASDTCARDAALSLEPSKPASDLCRRAVRADELCRVNTFSSSACLEEVKIYDDEVLRRAARCYDGACVDQSRCLEYVFGYPYPYVYPYPREIR
ncbi:MAG: hypothetical protein QM778_34860 [Myxococcales bacterium]